MMTDSLSPEIIHGLPSLKQKFLVDLVNGIDVNRDHIRMQRDNDGFWARMWNAFTGEEHRRQNQINENVIEGLDGCLQWLNNLTEHMTYSNNALVQMNDGLNKVKVDLAKVANFAVDVKGQLDELQRKVDYRFSELEIKIHEVDLRQRAYQQMDALFVSWRAGNFFALSLAQRCFLVASELAWGVFGDYCKVATADDREKILSHLRDLLITQVNQDANVLPGTRVDSDVWLQANGAPNQLGQQYQQAVSYLGNHLDPQKKKFTWFVLNTDSEHREGVPFVMNSSRLIKGMSNDLLREGYLYVS